MTFDQVRDAAIARALATCESPFEAQDTDLVPTLSELDDRENEGLLIETTILYCDMRGSSTLPMDHRRGTAARIYRSFLNCVVDVGRHYHGQIRAFAGDQVMMLFDRGPDMYRFALQAALGIQVAVEEGLNPIYRRMFEREVHCGVGIDFGRMLAIRVGGRGRSISDLVWVGEPANVASRLCNDATAGQILITPRVYERAPPGFKRPVLWGALGDDVWSTRRDMMGFGEVEAYEAPWDDLSACLARSGDKDNA